MPLSIVVIVTLKESYLSEHTWSSPSMNPKARTLTLTQNGGYGNFGPQATKSENLGSEAQRSGMYKAHQMTQCTPRCENNWFKAGVSEPWLELGSCENLFKTGHQEYKGSRTFKREKSCQRNTRHKWKGSQKLHTAWNFIRVVTQTWRGLTNLV